MTERHPRWVYDAGDEPDPRYSLANERTFLAWVRTTLAMIAGAVALHTLGLPEPRWLRTTIAVTLMVLGAGLTALAYARWARVEKAMRTRQPLPAFTLGLAMTAAVVLVAGLLAVALVVNPG
jgi:putative membrane protein